MENYANFPTLEYNWMFVLGEKPKKNLVKIEQQYILCLIADLTPSDRIAAVALDLPVKINLKATTTL